MTKVHQRAGQHILEVISFWAGLCYCTRLLHIFGRESFIAVPFLSNSGFNCQVQVKAVELS